MEVKSLCCTPETDRGLYVKPISIKLKKEKKKKKKRKVGSGHPIKALFLSAQVNLGPIHPDPEEGQKSPSTLSPVRSRTLARVPPPSTPTPFLRHTVWAQAHNLSVSLSVWNEYRPKGISCVVV